MTYVGGLRARLIRDSVYTTIDDALRALGWYEPGRHQPITFVPEPVDIENEIPLNTLALGDDEKSGQPLELGSHLAERTWPMWVDFYAEDDGLSLHVIEDISAILEGLMPSIDRGRPVIVVIDSTLATPSPIFNVEVEDVRTDRGRGFAQPWLAHWRTCNFRVVDSYADEDDPPRASG